MNHIEDMHKPTEYAMDSQKGHRQHLDNIDEKEDSNGMRTTPTVHTAKDDGTAGGSATEKLTTDRPSSAHPIPRAFKEVVNNGSREYVHIMRDNTGYEMGAQHLPKVPSCVSSKFGNSSPL